jgi:hypothetical protein
VHRPPTSTRRALRVLVPTAVGCLLATAAVTTPAAAAAAPSTADRAHDYADGRAMSVLPPGAPSCSPDS